VPFGLLPVWSARNIQTRFWAGFGARHTKSRPLLGFPRKSADAVFRLGRCDAVGWRGAAPETMERAEAGAAEAAFTAPETYGLRRILLWKNT